jgi:hypothetical protein
VRLDGEVPVRCLREWIIEKACFKPNDSVAYSSDPAFEPFKNKGAGSIVFKHYKE